MLQQLHPPLGVLFNHDDQDSHEDKSKDSSNNKRSLDSSGLLVSVETEPEAVNSNGDGEEEYHPEVRVRSACHESAQSKCNTSSEKTEKSPSNSGLASPVLVE